MMKQLCTYLQASLKKPTSKTKVIQEVVSPEVSKLNHAVTNKKQGDQMQFSRRGSKVQ